MSRTDDLVSDLAAEQELLDVLLGHLSDAQWATTTPAAGWDVRDQISHLAYFDATAALALTEPERFEEHKASLLAGGAGDALDVARGRSVEARQLLAGWRSGTRELLDAARVADPGRRVPWYGPEMSLASFVTARLMETWAHGQDVRDALSLPPSVSERLRHICHIGVSARPYAFQVHGLVDRGTPVRVEATAPDGKIWTWGEVGADEVIAGSALGLALVFTQRRHPGDTDVRASGETANAWLSIAQAFAGPPGRGRDRGLAMPGLENRAHSSESAFDPVQSSPGAPRA